MTATEIDPVKVAPALRRLEHLLVSARHARRARKWPWAWYCTTCPAAYGAAKTQPQAREAAESHRASPEHQETSA